MTSKQRKRKISALERLKKQLKSGVKPKKVDGKTTNKNVELSESDVKRIENQINVLEKKVG
jgi:HAMP domain-containing protein